MLSDSTLKFGEQFCTALLGLDALYAEEQAAVGSTDGSSIERLVVLNMSKTHQPDALGSYDKAIARFVELRDQAASLPEADRQLYYAQASQSAIAFAEWRSAGLAFPDQLHRFLHIPSAPASDAELDAIRAEIRNLLTELGFSGDLKQQCLDWEEGQRVPVDEVSGTLDDLLSQAWDLTAELMEMPGEKSDGMRVTTVSGAPFNARCDFSNRMIDLNIDPILTIPALRHLAVHEGYPGHYVQFKRREQSYLNGTGPADNLLSVVNTASSSPFEGIADYGMVSIGWANDLNSKLGALFGRYHAGIGTVAAWRMHADGWTPDAVKDGLYRDALIGGDGWVDNRLRFISRHDRATLIWSYWQGEPYVAAASQKITADNQTAWFDYLYDRMHSLKTVGMFKPS